MFLELKKAHAKIANIYVENKMSEISDNYHLLCNTYIKLKRERKSLNKYSYLLRFAREYTERNNFTFTKESYVEYMKNLPYELDKPILDTMPSLILAYTLIKIAENEENVRNGIELIRTLSKTDMSKLEHLLFASERFLETEELYDAMTSETKSMYRTALSRFAKKHNYTLKTAESVIENSDKTIGETLFPEKRNCLFFFLSFALFLPLFAFFYSEIELYSLILMIPLWLSTGEISDLILSKVCKKDTVLRVDPTKCDEDIKTLVVTTSLIGDSDALFENIELFYLANQSSPSLFGLLLDYPDSETEKDEKSALLADKAKRKINELNEKYENRFFLFLRKRVKNSDGKYYGWERKRGAVTELVRFLHDENTTIEHFVGDKTALSSVKYLLTLDSDTNLTLESVNEIMGAMMHPRYLPKVEHGRVVKGYGIMQPKMRTSIDSASKTPFSAMMSGSGGTDIYESASYDRYMNIFSEGAFCGKGIIDVDLFHELIDLPEGYVLSHDLPEGAILRTRSIGDVTLSDSTPKNMLSYATRNARWCRGDIQNLWLFGKIKSRAGRFMLLSNIARLISPILTLTAIVLSLFASEDNATKITLLSLLPSVLPFAVSVVLTPSYFVMLTKRRTFSKITKNAVLQIYVTLYKILSLCYTATVNLVSALRSLVRMTITKKKRLEWITASEIDRSGKGGFWYFVQRMISSCVVGAALFVFGSVGITRLLGFLWFFFPVFAYAQSFPKKARESSISLNRASEHISRMYRFFGENVNETTNHLPPDNISFFPSEKTAMRTSPTNIGLYLLSTVCATDMSVITKEELKERFENTLQTLEKIEKWNGHLYNWYDLENLSVLGNKYVSTVDSGNFITCVVVCVEALREYGLPELADSYEKFTNADMTKLYCSERELFYLGYDGNREKHGDICYDLYMSEARTTSYFAVAKGEVPKKHWKSLARTLLEENGYLGMASWTGTAFEYFMPMLLFPDVKNSFPSEALRFAYHRQLDYSNHSVYGISESGYYSFDSEMNYQYKAFGVPKLGLKNYTESEYVYSPYSTYLMMYLSQKRASKNLHAFEKLGAFGKYGFYEAVDFRNEIPRVIKSYMSHHVGMSVCALTNLAKNNILRHRFMRNKYMKCARELLEERIPDIGVYKNASRDYPSKRTIYEQIETLQISSTPCDPSLSFIDGGGLSVIVSTNGNVSLRAGELLLNDCNFTSPHTDKTIKTSSSGSVRLEQGNETISLVCDEECKNVTFGVSGNCFVIKLRTADKQNFLDFDVVLEREKDFYAHSSFSRLFVTSEYDEKTNILFFVRRNRKTKNMLYLAVSRADGLPFDFKTRRDGSIGETGGTLYPSLHAEGRKGEKETVFLLSVAKSSAEAEDKIISSRKNPQIRGKTASSPLTRSLLKNILFRYNTVGETELKRDRLFSYGISGDFPLIFVAHPSPSLLREYLTAFAELIAIGIRCELAVSAEDEDEYTKENTRQYKKIVREMGYEHFLSKKGGVFIIPRLDEETKRFFELFSVSTPRKQNITQYIRGEKEQYVPTYPPESFKTKGGFFTENGYTVICDEVKDTKWSFVLSGVGFGTVLTHDSLGFSYYLNSTKGRLTYFSGDVYSNYHGENLYAYFGNKRCDLIEGASTMYVSTDLVIYSGNIGVCSYKVYVTVSHKYPIKFLRVVSDISIEAEYNAIPSDKESVMSHSGSATSLMRENALAVGVIGKGLCNCIFTEGVGVKSKGNDIVFFLVGGKNRAFCESLREKIDLDFYFRELQKEKTPLPPIKMHFGEKWMNLLANKFLPYQVLSSRFRAKSGFFQSSGAFGYRDQLQDIMMLCYSDPKIARTHIIRCSARQYEDGSVNHWFFPEGDSVKTKCSDDFMYLPLAVAHYVELTADTSVLDVKTEYLASSPLQDKSERFERPNKSGNKDTVYEHCKRSLQNSLKRGKHGLPPLGSCDWNDGFSHFGEKGIGESVLNAMQYVWIYEKFTPIMRQKGDEADAEFFENEAKKLRASAGKCFEVDRFIRAYGDGGEKLGSEDCDECKIDLTVQAFSVIADIGTKEMQKLALETMWTNLFDEEYQVMRLFSPSFTKNDRNVGYIQGYIDGIRENGGQYTHAAVWALIALCKFGMTERALNLVRALSPSWRMSVGGEITEAYKSEPYALCGDVYYSPKFKGRGGWSHYTGSAGWYYRAILENVMGIELRDGFKTVTVKALCEYEAEIGFFGNVKIIAKNGKNKVLLDGQITKFPIKLDGDDHLIEVFTENIHRFER